MADPGATLLARLAGIVGASHVLTAAADLEPFVADWRGRYRGAARAVVLPGVDRRKSPRSCARARETGTPIVPQGGNTGLVRRRHAGRRRARDRAVARAA